MRVVGVVTFTATLLLWFVWWYAVAGILYLMAILINNHQTPFESLLPLAVLSSVPLLARDAFTLVILLLKGGPGSRQEFIPAMGLNLLPLDWPPYLWRVLNHFNLFELATVLIACYGLTLLTGGRGALAGVCLVSIWLGWSLLLSIPG